MLNRIIAIILPMIMTLSLTSYCLPSKVKASSIPDSFAKGADVSWLPQLEALGYKFYNDLGEEQDLLHILKDHGIDSIRIRAFVDPSDDPSNGHSSTEEVVALASRVSALGFKVMIDLHYSDSWADPGKQVTPKAWANDNLDQLKVHVSEYTSEVMNALKDAGVTPEWVQIGNEINNGMLHPLGGYSNTSNLVQLIQAGSSAAKSVFPEIKVIIHRANGAEAGVDPFFADLVEAGLLDSDYDIIGLSYYPDPVFTNSINELSGNMNKLAEKYGKEVMVVEVGGNVSTDADSVYNMLVAVQNKLHAVPNGLGTGIFYWAPEGIYFDYPYSAWNPDGSPSFAMDAFIDGAVEVNRYPVQSVTLDKRNITIEVGAVDNLTSIFKPENATYKGVKYSSSRPDIAKVDPYTGVVSGLAVGEATISVLSYDGGFTDSSEITVVPSTSLIQNPGFEDGLNSWAITGDTDAVNSDVDAHSGALTLHYWSPKAAEFTVSQTITGLENGLYKLSAWVSGGGEEESSEIFAGTRKQEFTNTGWRQWSNPTIDNIEVTDGTLTVGAHLKFSGGQWGNIDDFKLVKKGDVTSPDPVTTRNLTVNRTIATWYLNGSQPATFGDGSGSGAFDYWDNKPIDFTITHEMASLTPGTYTMTAKVFGDKGDPASGSEMFTRSGVRKYSTPVKYTDSAWTKPRTLTLENVLVENGEIVTLGFTIKSTTNDHYGYLDDVTFVRTGGLPVSIPSESTANPLSNPDSVLPSPQLEHKVLTNPLANAEGIIEVSLSTKERELQIPANASTINGLTALMVKRDGVILEFPGKVLKELQSSIGKDLNGKMISFGLSTLSSEKANALIQQAEEKCNAELKMVGEIVDFSLSVIDQNGNKTNLTKFDEPITLSLKVRDDGNKNLYGVYHIAEDGSFEYVGGTLDEDHMVVKINHHSGKYTVLEYDKTFEDVERNYWAHDVIKEVAAKHIFEGISENLFAPRSKVTRAEFAAILVRTLGLTATTGSPFADVDNSMWYADEISAAYEAGIIKGQDALNFAPEAPITRQEMAAIIMRAYEIHNESTASQVSSLTFADNDKIDPWARDSIEAAKSLGFVQGNPEGYYLPQAFANRAECAKVMILLLKNIS